MAFHNVFAVLLIFLSLWLREARAYSCFFKNPPPDGPSGDFSLDHIVYVGDTLDVSWSTDWNTSTLSLYQNNDTGTDFLIHSVATGLTDISSFTWTVDVSDFLPIYPVSSHNPQNVFFFWLFNEDNNNQECTCHYFNISQRSTSSSTSSALLSSTTSSTQRSTASSPSTARQGGATSSPSPSPSPSSSGLSEGAKVGIGIGIGAGVCGIAIGVIVGLCLRRRRNRERPEQRQETSQPWQGDTTGRNNAIHQDRRSQRSWSQAFHRQQSPVELDGHGQPSEMWGRQADPHELHSSPNTWTQK